MKITYSIYDHDFLPEGGYGWTQIQKTTIKKSYEELIFDLMNEFDIEYGKGGIWQCAKYNEDGQITGFIFHHKGSTKEHVYEIIY